MSLSLGGQCLCCGCPRCTQSPTVVQATLSVIVNDLCNSIPGCDAINTTYVLDYTADAELPDAELITPSEDLTGCKWSAAIPAVSCSTASCDGCECEYGFSDPAGGYTDDTCDGLCNPDPIADPIVGGPGAGTYTTTPDADCVDCTTDTCEYACGDEQEIGACSCVSDGFGGWECTCSADCECETTCTPEAGVIEVYLYRQAVTLEAVLFVRVRMPTDRYLRGEWVSGDTAIDCLAEFGPKNVSLTQYIAGVAWCGDPTDIDVEFL